MTFHMVVAVRGVFCSIVMRKEDYAPTYEHQGPLGEQVGSPTSVSGAIDVQVRTQEIHEAKSKRVTFL